MDHVKEILSILDYDFDERLFVLFWGSKNNWDELIENNDLVEVGEGKYQLIQACQLSVERIKEVHKELYGSYLKYFARNHQIFYEDAQWLHRLMRNATYHSIACEEYYDLAYSIVEKLRWFVYWNLEREWIWEYFDKIPVDSKLQRWIKFYRIFELVLPYARYDDQNANELIDNLGALLNKETEEKLTFEIYNLQGIISLQIDNISKAIEKFENSYEVATRSSCKEMQGKALLNLGLIKYQDEKSKMLELLLKAKASFENSYYIALVNYNLLNLGLLNDSDPDFTDIKLKEYVSGMINKYPDLSRKFLVLLRKKCLQNNNISGYFQLKSWGILLSMLLYLNDYMDEFYTLLGDLPEMLSKDMGSAYNGLNIIVETYNDLDMEDEMYFFMGLRDRITLDQFNEVDYIGNIANESLKSEFREQVSKIAKML